MAQETDAQLQTRRATIENETVTNANSTTRVGDMLENIIDSKINKLNTSNDTVDPTQDQDVATKFYVDNASSGGTDFVTLVDAAPVVVDCENEKEPKFYLETATSRTLDLQNLRGNNVLNDYSVLTFLIKKTTASDIVITLDAGFTNRDILTDGIVTTYTLAGASNVTFKLTALVLGQASGAIIWWNLVATSAGLSSSLATDNVYIGVGGVATAKALGAEFDTSGSIILAALGITGGKIANSTVTLAKLLGSVGSGERVLVENNSGVVSDPYATTNGTITDSTVITNLETESGWSNETKSVSNTFEGQSYSGTGSTGVKYFYRITVDGTAIRVPIGQGVELTSIQIPPFTEVTGTTQQLAINNGYIANNAALVTLTLPTVAALGDRLVVCGKGAGGWRVAQNASQIIHGTTDSTTGATGRLDSTARYDCINLRCIVANNEWVIESVKGTVTIT